ncbi:eukaryotic translation initiation factor 2C, 2, partial [Modicella reniformis]
MPGSSGSGIAAVVASLDLDATRYTESIRIQETGCEYIDGLEGMAVDLLKAFYRTCTRKPERIVFYRSGVPEGLFADVARNEVSALKRACQSLEMPYTFAITYVFVRKSRHTRFFPTRRGDIDRSQNYKPGLVVDTEIVDPVKFDFYLQSHATVLGTSMPAHYHVLYDDNKFSSDELQLLTYRLCYLNSRDTRATSMVLPVYYAHLVALRARFHTRLDWDDNWTPKAYDAVKPSLCN